MKSVLIILLSAFLPFTSFSIECSQSKIKRQYVIAIKELGGGLVSAKYCKFNLTNSKVSHCKQLKGAEEIPLKDLQEEFQSLFDANEFHIGVHMFVIGSGGGIAGCFAGGAAGLMVSWISLGGSIVVGCGVGFIAGAIAGKTIAVAGEIEELEEASVNSQSPELLSCSMIHVLEETLQE